MVNRSKVNQSRFWKLWKDSGAVGTRYSPSYLKMAKPAGKWEEYKIVPNGPGSAWDRFLSIRDRFGGMLSIALKEGDRTRIKYDSQDVFSHSQYLDIFPDGRINRVEDCSKSCRGCGVTGAPNVGGDRVYFAKNLLKLLPRDIKKNISPLYIK